MLGLGPSVAVAIPVAPGPVAVAPGAVAVARCPATSFSPPSATSSVAVVAFGGAAIGASSPIATTASAALSGLLLLLGFGLVYVLPHFLHLCRLFPPLCDGGLDGFLVVLEGLYECGQVFSLMGRASLFELFDLRGLTREARRGSKTRESDASRGREHDCGATERRKKGGGGGGGKGLAGTLPRWRGGGNH